MVDIFHVWGISCSQKLWPLFSDGTVGYQKNHPYDNCQRGSFLYKAQFVFVERLGNSGEFLNCGKEFTLGPKKKGNQGLQPGHSVALTAFETVDFSRETVRKIYPEHDLHAFISPSTDLSREGNCGPPTTQIDAGYHGTLNWRIIKALSE